MNQALFSANTCGIDILDFVTGEVKQSILSSFKQIEVEPSRIKTLPLFFATERDNSNMTVFTLNNQKEKTSIQISEHIDVFKFSPSGTWLVGSVNSSFKVWEISSGNLVASIDLESKVSVLEFTSNEQILFSATESGKIYGWNIYELFNELPTAAFIWETGASVKHIKTGYNQGMIYTVSHKNINDSIESSIKLWNLVANDADSSLIYTYDVNTEITAMCIDSAERAVYVGTASGEILPIERFVVNPTTGLVDYPIENGQVASVDITRSQTLVHGTNASVTSMILIGKEVFLVAGYADGIVASFKTHSRDLDKTLKPADTHAVTNLSILGSIDGCCSKISQIGELPKQFCCNKSSKDAASRLEHEVWIKLDDQSSQITVNPITGLEQKIKLGANFFSLPEMKADETANDKDKVLRLKIKQLEQELAQVLQ